MPFLQGSEQLLHVLGDDQTDWETRSKTAIQKVYPLRQRGGYPAERGVSF